MKKKILLLGNHAFVIYNFRKELIRKLLSKGYDVYISLPNDHNKVPEMVSWGCKFIETHIDRRGKNPVKDLKLVFLYLKMLNRIEPDVVLTYTIKPNLYGGIACRLLNIPYINNITGLGSGFNGGKLIKILLTILYRIGLKKSSWVFFQNSHDMNILTKKRIVNKNYSLLPGSGVNLEEFKYKEYPEQNPITFLFIGRIMKDKGIDQYLEAAKIIKKKYSNTKFNIIGFVEETQSHYKGIISKYEDDGYVNYLGYQADVKPFIEEAHCLIQPSHGGEGLSNVLLEAGAMGRVLIASDIPGCREVIVEGKNGYLFEPKNTESLVSKIERYIHLPLEENKKMGKYSRKKIRNQFDRKLVINAYLKQINKIT